MQRSSSKNGQVKASLSSAKAKVKARVSTSAANRATKKSAKAAAKQAERVARARASKSAQIQPEKLSRKEQKAQFGKRHMLWDDWLLLGIVVFSTLMIIGALCTNFIDTPREAAEKELSKIADNYYITYMYPRLLGSLDNDPTEMLSKYKDIGVSATYLRQLLKYNDGEFAASAPVFAAIACDTNHTSVRYFPTEPYGPRDYTVDYVWDCDE